MYIKSDKKNYPDVSPVFDTKHLRWNMKSNIKRHNANSLRESHQMHSIDCGEYYCQIPLINLLWWKTYLHIHTIWMEYRKIIFFLRNLSKCRKNVAKKISIIFTRLYFFISKWMKKRKTKLVYVAIASAYSIGGREIMLMSIQKKSFKYTQQDSYYIKIR